MEETEEAGALLRQYYTAGPAAQMPLESKLLTLVEPRIRRFLRDRCHSGEESEDLWSEFCLRMLPALRAGSLDRMENAYIGRAFTLARNVLRDTQRRDNPWYAFKLRVKYLATDPQQKHGLSRWFLEGQFLIGLTPLYGRPFEFTPAYAAFCQDNSLYLNEVFPRRSPSNEKEVPLSELMRTLLHWVQTPLHERPFIMHLAVLHGIEKIAVSSLDSLADRVDGSPAETLAAPEPDRETIDWELCWNELRTFSTALRRIVLLSLDRPLLVMLTGMPDPTLRLLEALECSEATLGDWMPRLPFDDESLAQELDIPKASLQTFRSRARERLRKRCAIGGKRNPTPPASGESGKGV